MLVTFYKELQNTPERKEGILSVKNLNIFELAQETSNFTKSIKYQNYTVFYNDTKEKTRTPSLKVPTQNGTLLIYGDFMVDSLYFYDDYLTERLDVDAGLDMLFLR